MNRRTARTARRAVYFVSVWLLALGCLYVMNAAMCGFIGETHGLSEDNSIHLEPSHHATFLVMLGGFHLLAALLTLFIGGIAVVAEEER